MFPFLAGYEWCCSGAEGPLGAPERPFRGGATAFVASYPVRGAGRGGVRPGGRALGRHPASPYCGACARLTKPWFPLAVLAAVLALVFGAARLPQPGIQLPDQPDWTGTWDTIWQGGGATLHLEQRGESGHRDIPPLRRRGPSGGGRPFAARDLVPAQASGVVRDASRPRRRDLRRALREPAVLERATHRERRGTPRSIRPICARRADAVATFLNSIYWSRAGQHERLQAAFRCIDFGTDAPEFVSTRVADAGLLFDVLDRTTFTFREFLGREDVLDLAESTVLLRQSGTAVTVPVTLTRNEAGEWRILWPGEQTLQLKLDELLAARGATRVDPKRHLRLDSPRATMQAFLESTGDWSNRGEEIATNCMDLSEIDASVRATDAQLFAFTLKRVIDAVGYVHLWGISDDPDNPLPYVHYRHALGDIVIAPVAEAQERGADDEAAVLAAEPMRWAFTTETLAGLRGLHDALEGMGAAYGLHDLPDDPYFALRQTARAISPDLVKRSFLLETWQWLGLVILGVGGWWLVGWMHQALRALVLRLQQTDGEQAAEDPEHTALEWRFLIPLRIAITSALWIVGFRYPRPPRSPPDDPAHARARGRCPRRGVVHDRHDQLAQQPPPAQRTANQYPAR